MAAQRIQVGDVIGKTITDIRCKFGKEDGWLDTAECFIELDRKFYISIPYGYPNYIFIANPDPGAESIFNNLTDIPAYHVNKDNKSIDEIAGTYKKQQRRAIVRFAKKWFGYQPSIPLYQPYKSEYRENKLKYIINRRITNYLWEKDETEKGFFELDNGYLITEQIMSPHGTGLAGLNYYESFSELKEEKGDGFLRYRI